MKTIKGIGILTILIMCLGIALADGGGAFTTDPAEDAGYAGPYTGGETTGDFSSHADTGNDCGGSPIPDWYMNGADICYEPPSGDADSDGCTNLIEYRNFIGSPLGNPRCLFEDNAICSDMFNRPTWCDTYDRHLGEEQIGEIPEFNGTALILIGILVFGVYFLQGHFHKK
jgi:hypothetical protein